MDIFNSEVMWIVIALFSLKLQYSSSNIYGSNFGPKSSCKRDFASLTPVKCLVRYLALVFPRIILLWGKTCLILCPRRRGSSRYWDILSWSSQSNKHIYFMDADSKEKKENDKKADVLKDPPLDADALCRVRTLLTLGGSWNYLCCHNTNNCLCFCCMAFRSSLIIGASSLRWSMCI